MLCPKCGSPSEEYYNGVESDGLNEPPSALSSASACFDTKKVERIASARECKNALQEYCYICLRNSALRHPYTECAKRLLSEGNFPANEDICREILLAEYPEEVLHETAGDVDDLSWEYILDDVFANNTAKGIKVWRCLLDIAEPSL